MTLITNGLEGQVAGHAGSNISTSGFSLGFNRGTGSDTNYAATHVAHGSMGLVLTEGSGAACSGNATIPSSASAAASRALYFTALPGSQIMVLGVGNVHVYITATGQLKVFNAVGAVLFTSTSVLSINTQYRVELVVIVNASTTAGTIKARVCPLDSSTPVGDMNYSPSTVNAGTANFTSVQFGNNVGGQTGTWTDYIDDMAIDYGATNFIGPWSTNLPPVADARAPVAAVEPFELVTLDGTHSSDPNSDPLTYAWSGPVALSDDTAASPTFTAPATLDGETLTFSLMVNDGTLDSDPDTVDVEILPHTVWMISSDAPSDAIQMSRITV
jgi:hypothetical protein